MDEALDGIYLNRPLHNSDKEVIERLTQPKHWDYERFKKSIAAVSITGTHIPAHNAPESIHLQGLRPHLDQLKNMTRQNEREHARTGFVNKETKGFVMHNRITVGTQNSGKLDWDLPPEQQKKLIRAFSIHTHPFDNNPETVTGHGLSGTDYKTFMGDRQQQCMFISFGNTEMFVMKTSATPDNLTRDSVARRVDSALQDYILDSNKHISERVIDFNTGICSELGLTIYIADEKNRDLATRRSVVK